MLGRGERGREEGREGRREEGRARGKKGERERRMERVIIPGKGPEHCRNGRLSRIDEKENSD